MKNYSNSSINITFSTKLGCGLDYRIKSVFNPGQGHESCFSSRRPYSFWCGDDSRNVGFLFVSIKIIVQDSIYFADMYYPQSFFTTPCTSMFEPRTDTYKNLVLSVFIGDFT